MNGKKERFTRWNFESSNKPLSCCLNVSCKVGSELPNEFFGVS